jgi:hypothetical protein
MAKSIRQVKSKPQIRQALVQQLRRSGTAKIDSQIELLKQFVDLDPIYTGTAEKFSIDGTREAWTRHSVELVQTEGHWLEFGVRSGTSLRWCIEARPTQVIHGFDSWEGLPEDWHTGCKTFRVGAMAVPMPVMPAHIHLHPGWFDKTVEPWLEQHPGPCAYIHIDSDLYSSAIYVLKTLNDRIVPGTIIVFDELCNFRLSGKMGRWLEHEWRALCEWLDQCQRQVKPIARSCMYQAAVRVIQ